MNFFLRSDYTQANLVRALKLFISKLTDFVTVAHIGLTVFSSHE